MVEQVYIGEISTTFPVQVAARRRCNTSARGKVGNPLVVAWAPCFEDMGPHNCQIEASQRQGWADLQEQMSQAGEEGCKARPS